MLVGVMGVTAGGVALPDLHQLPRKRLPVGPQQAPRDVDALALRCSALTDREVCVLPIDVVRAKDRAGGGKQVRWHRDQGPAWCPQTGRPVCAGGVRGIDRARGLHISSSPGGGRSGRRGGPMASCGLRPDLVIEVGGIVEVMNLKAGEASFGAHLLGELPVETEGAQPRSPGLGQGR